LPVAFWIQSLQISGLAVNVHPMDPRLITPFMILPTFFLPSTVGPKLLIEVTTARSAF
jgi:hypothetical protein